jgi:hypothetical protein
MNTEKERLIYLCQTEQDTEAAKKLYLLCGRDEDWESAKIAIELLYNKKILIESFHELLKNVSTRLTYLENKNCTSLVDYSEDIYCLYNRLLIDGKTYEHLHYLSDTPDNTIFEIEFQNTILDAQNKKISIECLLLDLEFIIYFDNIVNLHKIENFYYFTIEITLYFNFHTERRYIQKTFAAQFVEVNSHNQIFYKHVSKEFIVNDNGSYYNDHKLSHCESTKANIRIQFKPPEDRNTCIISSSVKLFAKESDNA